MISQIGDRFTQMAFIELLGTEFFGNFAAFGGIAVVFTLPSIILGPITGPIIDSWRKKKVLVTGDIVRGFLILSLPLVYAASHTQGTGSLIAMLAVALVVYVFGFFFNSARLAFIPLLVPRKVYMQANSANMTILRAATGIGTLAGGVVVHFIGWKLGFIFDAITYFISFILILLIKVDEKPLLIDASRILAGTKTRILSYLERLKRWFDFLLNMFTRAAVQFAMFPSLYVYRGMEQHFENIRDGVKLMTRTLMMRFVMFSILVLFFISGVAFTVIVPTIQQTLGMGTLGVTVLAIAVAGGMFLGPFFTGIFGPAYPRHKLMIFSYLLIGIGFVFAGGAYLLVGLEKVLATPWIHWTMISVMGLVLFVAGILFSAINISQDTLIQELIPHTARGRLFAWREALASFAFVTTAVPAGFIADAVSFEYVLVAVGIIVAGFAVVWIPLLWRKSQKEISIINGG